MAGSTLLFTTDGWTLSFPLLLNLAQSLSGANSSPSLQLLAPIFKKIKFFFKIPKTFLEFWLFPPSNQPWLKLSFSCFSSVTLKSTHLSLICTFILYISHTSYCNKAKHISDSIITVFYLLPQPVLLPLCPSTISFQISKKNFIFWILKKNFIFLNFF
jgi:hypothetical protein